MPRRCRPAHPRRHRCGRTRTRRSAGCDRVRSGSGGWRWMAWRQGKRADSTHGREPLWAPVLQQGRNVPLPGPPDARDHHHMAARSFAQVTISFGLVSIPVDVYSAEIASSRLSFNLLHARDGARVKQQYICALDGEVLDRAEMVKGYEYEKDQYVMFK